MRWNEWQAHASNTSNWENQFERGLIKVEHIRDHLLHLWFEEDKDVTIYELDFAALTVDDNPGGVFAPLAEVSNFSVVKGEYALVWANPETGLFDDGSIDLAPEAVRFFCERYGTLLKAAGSAPQRLPA